MARARSIKPGFFKNEDLAECSLAARLCFAGLWTLADRTGRLEDRPKRIKGELFAYDSIEVEPLLQELDGRGGFIHRYRIGDQALIQILNFGKHQNPHHREAPSILAAPVGWTDQTPEPEAGTALHEGKASGKPQASPGLDPPTSDLARGQNPADSGLLTPDSLFSDSGHSDSLLSSDLPSSGSAVAAIKLKPVQQKKGKAKEPAPTTATWEAYSEAYESRYATAPLRNAKVNGQLASLLKRIPIEEAPEVARFYVGHTDRFYCQAGHAVDLLLLHAEKLRTEWATGNLMASGARPTTANPNFKKMDYHDGTDFQPAGELKTRHLPTTALMTGAARTTEAFNG